jgi:hypothetical protein
MPSTRGRGSKMICCCSLALLGVILQTDLAERELWTIFRPTHSGVINDVAVLSHLYNDVKLNRFSGH